jgi:hypothetical protein
VFSVDSVRHTNHIFILCVPIDPVPPPAQAQECENGQSEESPGPDHDTNDGPDFGLALGGNGGVRRRRKCGKSQTGRIVTEDTGGNKGVGVILFKGEYLMHLRVYVRHEGGPYNPLWAEGKIYGKNRSDTHRGVVAVSVASQLMSVRFSDTDGDRLTLRD